MVDELICENGVYREPTADELEQMKKNEEQYWQTTPYGVAVANEIHKKYSLDDENALHRQKDEKPEEYAEYYAYCEQCKAYVKERKGSA